MSPLVSFPDQRVPVVLSTHAAELVAADAAAILRYLTAHPGVAVADVAAHLLRTRRIRRHRAVVRAADRSELITGLTAVAAGEDHPLVARSSEAAAPRLAFVLPGQGNQWPGMGADAYRRLAVYRAEADTFDAAFRAAGAVSPLGYLLGDAEAARYSQTEIQGAQFVHAVSLAAVWRSCGVTPDLTVGHSLGEVAAAYLAGAITGSVAAAVVVARAGVVDGLSGRYGMAVLGVAADVARQSIDSSSGWLELSVVNAGSSVVVSGDRDAVTELVAATEARGQFARHIDVDFPAHTSALEPLRNDLLRRLPAARFADTAAQFIGSATGTVVPADTDFLEYWYGNLRNTVRFDQAIRTALHCGATAFVELSAHPALLFALEDLLERTPDGPAVLVGSGHRDRPPIDELSAAIATAALADPGFRWTDHLDATGATLLDGFPNAPMRTDFFWAAPTPLPPVPAVTVAAEKWSRVGSPIPAGTAPKRVAIIDLGAGAELVAALRAAVEAKPDVVAADAAEAVVVLAPALDGTDAPGAAAELAGRIDTGLLDYVESLPPNCREVWLVTAGAEQVRIDEPAPKPAQAALAAMHRSLGFEFPDHTFGHLDLPSWESAEAAHVVDALRSGGGALAVRDGTLLRRELDENPPAAPAGQPTSGQLDNVVITGGSGAIALHFARHLIEQGARRIVLLSRSGPAAPGVVDIVRACPPGVEVLAPVCDITDRAAVAAAAAEHGGAGASLVIHAAGTAQFATRDQLTGADLESMSAAKLTGLAHLAEEWPLRDDARMVLCSSVIGVWGGKGAAGYAAANRMLDVMAAQLRARGRRCVSVRWGLWHGSDIIDASEISRVQRSGLRPMAELPAVRAGLRDHLVDPLVLTADLDRLRAFFGSQEAPESVPAAETDGSAGAAAAVQAELVAVLNLTDRALDSTATLFDLGMDSLLALELRKRIKRVTGATLPLATLLGGITVLELIAAFEPKESELLRD
ncbi:MAG: mycobactin polyketide synthase MbtD [Mycobacterium sp.]